MVITLDSFIADFKAENSKYDSSGLIDDISVIRWFMEALEPFGLNIMQMYEHLVEVRDRKAFLPDNFYSLYIAYKCDATEIKPKRIKKNMIDEVAWVETTEKTKLWETCDPCCGHDLEKLIVKRTYINDYEFDEHYLAPTLLKLGKNLVKSRCYDHCRNKVVKDCPFEIVINNLTLYANFEEGDVYLQYYGYPVDEENRPVIPETDLGNLAKYVQYYVQLKFFEKLLRNTDEPRVGTLLQYYSQRELEYRKLAKTDVKVSRFDPSVLNKIKLRNKRDMLRYELKLPIL